MWLCGLEVWGVWLLGCLNRGGVRPEPDPVTTSLCALESVGISIVIVRKPGNYYFEAKELLRASNIEILAATVTRGSFVLKTNRGLRRALGRTCSVFGPGLVNIINAYTDVVVNRSLGRTVSGTSLPYAMIPIRSRNNSNRNSGAIKTVVILRTTISCNMVPRRRTSERVTVLRGTARIRGAHKVTRNGCVGPGFNSSGRDITGAMIRTVGSNGGMTFIRGTGGRASCLFTSVVGFSCGSVGRSGGPVVITGLSRGVNLREVENRTEEVGRRLPVSISCVANKLSRCPIATGTTTRCLGSGSLSLVIMFNIPRTFPVRSFSIRSITVASNPHLIRPLGSLKCSRIITRLSTRSGALKASGVMFSSFNNVVESTVK